MEQKLSHLSPAGVQKVWNCPIAWLGQTKTLRQKARILQSFFNVIFHEIFKKSNFSWSWVNITDNEELPFSLYNTLTLDSWTQPVQPLNSCNYTVQPLESCPYNAQPSDSWTYTVQSSNCWTYTVWPLVSWTYTFHHWTVEYTLSNLRTVGYPLSNHWTVYRHCPSIVQ